MKPDQRGLYETLFTEGLAAQLQRLDSHFTTQKEALRPAEAADCVALHLGRVIRGSLTVAQFWPNGSADADTATVELVLVGKTPFMYVDDNDRLHPTRVFENAELMGRQRVIRHDKIFSADKINVRLQGIDAPGLHFQPAAKGSKGKNGKFRQSLGETCSHALLRYLSRLGQKEISCEVVFRVSKPSDVCDVYGRVVGNLIIVNDGSRVDLNHWLIREGWALPGFYNSMTQNEVRLLQPDHATAVQNRRGMFSREYVTARLAAFDPKRRYRKGPPTFKPFRDRGAVNFPKFFRRQADHYVRRAIGDAKTPAQFSHYVATKKDDRALAVKTFLNHQELATASTFKKQFSKLAEFLQNGRYPTGPELVFWEAEAKVVKAGAEKQITSW